jgi:hypothetical protein
MRNKTILNSKMTGEESFQKKAMFGWVKFKFLQIGLMGLNDPSQARVNLSSTHTHPPTHEICPIIG